MKSIALISDTHGQLPKDVVKHLEAVDEIWHAGDIGHSKVLDQMEAICLTRAVYGNIDDHQIRLRCPLKQLFDCEGLKVFMTHIGGYPGRYHTRVRNALIKEKPALYICGHSHICKVVKDPALGLLHINPGACGHIGFHKLRTMVLLDCEDSRISNVRVVELGKRGNLINH